MSTGSAPPKRVWILGAGFSRSLGGPLLNDLLSLRMHGELKARYPNQMSCDGAEARAVYSLYHFGRAFSDGRPPWVINKGIPGLRIWRDAEQFLDYLDAAQSSASAQQRLQAMWGELTEGGTMPPCTTLARAARRLIAAECSVFMKDFDPQLEPSEPYVAWAHSLTGHDTLITFNYDTLVEQAADAPRVVDGHEFHGPGVHVVMFARAGQGESPDYASEVHKAEAAKQPILIKLHGSVDWEPAEGNPFLPFQRSRDLEWAVTAPLDAEGCLAVPGPSKKKSTSGQLRRLWELAEQRIKLADEIVFIGFRFPPSDSQARSRLLGAIAQNTTEPGDPNDTASKRLRRKLTITTVLGDDTASTARLHHLLTYAASVKRLARNRPGVNDRTGVYEIRSVPLFAEDYLSVLDL